MREKEGYVRWFSELGMKDVGVAGVKGANLAEMYNKKLPVPAGFVISVKACDDFIKKSGISEQISQILSGFEIENELDLKEASARIRKIIEGAKLPKELENEIVEAYDVLDVDKINLGKASGGALDILRNSHEPPFVSVRSSAGEEDSDEASFAGQHESFLNVKGSDDLLRRVKQCFSSAFSSRAIYYRHKNGIGYEDARIAVIIQRMIDSYKSGVLFTKNPLKNDKTMLVEATWGLGPGVVSSKVNPDVYVLDSGLELVRGEIGDKKIAVVRNSSGQMDEVPLKKERTEQQVLTGHELKRIVQIGLQIEEHYKKPMDIEFAVDEEGIYVLQARPMTGSFYSGEGEMDGNVLFSGNAISGGVSSGAVRFVRSEDDASRLRAGEVIVAESVTPEMVIAMHRASGIITNIGGVCSHAGIIAREIGVPFIVTKENLVEKLREGQIVSVDGSTGRIIEGSGIEKKYQINPVLPTKTKIKIYLDLPDYAERASKSGVREVGLVRFENVIASSGKHISWYLKNNKMDELAEFLHSSLNKMVLHFDSAWFRLSDVRTNEHKNLEGADKNVEQNPMLGNHGIRFALRNVQLLEAELSAVKNLADNFHNKSFGIMLPHVSSLSEITEAKKIFLNSGMPSNVKFGVAIETPAAVQMINEICEKEVDFVSIGTDALIQHTLAVDKNNLDLKELYDEASPAVLNSIKHVLERCRRLGVESSIYGEASSNPRIIKLALGEGIGSFTVGADSAENVSKIVSGFEKRLEVGRHVISENARQVIGDIEEESIVRPDGVFDLMVNSIVQKENEQEPMPTQMPIPEMEEKSLQTSNETDEELILKALDEGGFEEENHYSPGFGASARENVPALNEAIPVDSEQFEEHENEGMMDLDSEAEKEAIRAIKGSSADNHEEPEKKLSKDEESDEDKVAEGDEDELNDEGDDDFGSMLGDSEVEDVESDDEVLDIF